MIEGRDICRLAIPNKEIHILYENLIRSLIKEVLQESKVDALIQALVSGDARTVNELLQEFVINALSVHDIPHSETERTYHLFVLGLLVTLEPNYEVRSNRESGYGRYDIMLIPKDRQKKGIVIEFKKASKHNSEDLEEAAQKALEQIDQKRYAHALHADGIKNVLSYGIAFMGKNVLVKLKEN